MELLDIFCEPNYRGEKTKNSFRRESEVVGWLDFHGSSKPITGIVAGREMRGIITTPTGELLMRTQTYIQVTGNEYILNSLPNSTPHDEGWSGKEVIITEDLPLEYAMKLKYSGVSEVSLTENTPYALSGTTKLLPLAA